MRIEKITPVIVALFLCFSQLVASEDVATTKDVNARNDDMNKIKSKYIIPSKIFKLKYLCVFLWLQFDIIYIFR